MLGPARPNKDMSTSCPYILMQRTEQAHPWYQSHWNICSGLSGFLDLPPNPPRLLLPLWPGSGVSGPPPASPHMGWASPYTHAAMGEGSYPTQAPYLPTHPHPLHREGGRSHMIPHTLHRGQGLRPGGWAGGVYRCCGGKPTTQRDGMEV